MSLLGGARRILLVGGEGVSLYAPTPRGLEREVALSWELPDFDRQLTGALEGRYRGSSLLILFDGADQTYRKEENIPRMSSFDRPRFIKRKLDQAFPTYPVRASAPIRPPKGAGNNAPVSYLFVAIPDTERLERISQSILEAAVPLSGLALLPAESTGLVTTLAGKLFDGAGKRSRWSVLISQHETGGLRQVVVKDGNLALTRLTPTTEAGVEGPGWAEEVMREFKATLTYIARFGYTAEDGLDVMVVCRDVEKQFFDQKVLPVSNFRCLSARDALVQLGVRSAILGEGNFGEAVYAAWVSRKKSLFLPVKMPGIQRILGPRLGAQAAAAALVLAFLAAGWFSVSDFSDYSTIRDETEQKHQQKKRLDGDYAKASEDFKTLPADPKLVKDVIGIKQSLDGNSASVAPFLNVLNKILDRDIKLQSLSFKSVEGTNTPTKKEPSIINITFKFTITGREPLEKKVVRAERFEEIVRQTFPSHDVKVEASYGNISRTGGVFSGQAGDAAAGAGAQDESATFVIQGPPL